MARRSVPPPKPKSPILTVGQKRRRIERLQKCITRLEDFDPQKAQKRAPAVLALEAAIDKALSSAFGYGTPAYLRYNQAATLDPSPLLTKATLRSPVLPPVGGPSVGAPGRHDAHGARQHFSENKERSIALIRKAINTLEDEIADAEPVVEAVQESKAAPVVGALRESKATQSRPWAGIDFKAAWRRVGRWWRGRN
jgi:hypothetical protein